jgi:hypothetical protein
VLNTTENTLYFASGADPTSLWLSIGGTTVSIVPATVPGVPNIDSATLSGTILTVVFDPPASNGGSVILDYTFTVSDDDINTSNVISIFTGAGAPNTSHTFDMLVLSSYPYVYVVARNAVGTGGSSSKSI